MALVRWAFRILLICTLAVILLVNYYYLLMRVNDRLNLNPLLEEFRTKSKARTDLKNALEAKTKAEKEVADLKQKVLQIEREIENTKEGADDTSSEINIPKTKKMPVNADEIKEEVDVVLDRSDNIVVTAFFLVKDAAAKSRHTEGEYFAQIARLFSCHDAMIIFTSPELAPKLKAMRANPQRTMVVPIRLDEIKASTLYPPNFWDGVSKAAKRNKKGMNGGFNEQIFRIWHSKVDFLKRAADIDPFNSKFFAWVDAGLLRWEEYTNSTMLQRIPPETEGKMLMLNVTPVLRQTDFQQIGAGIFGGNKKAISRYNQRYYERVEQIAKSNIQILSNEQIVMHDTCALNPGLCFVVTAKGGNRHQLNAVRQPYFFMIPFLRHDEFKILQKTGFIKRKGWKKRKGWL